jgi:hypothetical protein
MILEPSERVRGVSSLGVMGAEAEAVAICFWIGKQKKAKTALV